MNPEMPQKPQDESEAQLTALLLGELPHEQAAALHQKLAQDAELAKRYERLRHTINLVRETLATPAAQTADQPTPLKLSEQRRAKLLQHFKTVAPKEFLPPRRRGMPWLVPVGIAAAFVVIVGSLAIPNFQAARTKSMGALSWGDTHAASEEPYAKLRRLAPTHGDRSEDLQAVTRRLDQASSGVQPPSTGTPLALPRMKADEAATPAGVAIVLPKFTEVIDATTTPTGAEGQQPGFAVSATLRGFYDDSLNRAGGRGGGGGFGGGGVGGSGGGVQGDGAAVEGRQKELAAADYFFSPQGQKDALASGRPMVERERMQALGDSPPPPVVADNSGQTLEYKADGIVPIVGPDGAPLPSAPQSQDLAAFRARYGLRREPAKDAGTGTGAGINAWQYPNNATAGDAFFSVDAETRRVATVEAQPPAAVPALSATPTPAQDALSQAVASQPVPGPALAPIKQVLVEAKLEVAGVPSQAFGKDKTAGDLTAGLRDAVPGKPAANVSKAGEMHLKQEVAGLDSANKLAEAGAARRETIGYYDLQNADPQDVYNNLHDLFQRNNVRQQANDQNALSGQTSPVYQRAANNVAPQPVPATPPADSTLAEHGEPKQAIAAEGRPSPNSSYYGGGAFGGYANIQKAPSDGDQGVPPARPALRSPKEGGLAGGIGGAAMSPPPPGLPEAAVNEAALRQANIDLSKQSDQQALGFDWYLGNSLAGKSQLAAKDSTAPAKVGQAEVEGKQVEELAKRSEPAPAFKGTPSDVPELGDVPAAGRLFRSRAAESTDQAKDQVAAGAVKLQVEEKVKSVDFGLNEEVQRQTNAVSLESVNTFELANGNPQDVNASLQGLFQRKAPAHEAHFPDQGDRARASSIVLPTTEGETGLALKNNSAVEQKSVQLADAKRELDELQRFRQILDMKIASEKIDVELPKTMVVEIVDKAVPPSSPSSTLWDKIRGKGDGFKSTARIKIERDAPDISGIMERGGNMPYDPYFVQTESEVIQSEAVLGKVIKDLNLNEAWGRKQGGKALTTAQTMALLKDKLNVRPEQGTSLLDIGVKSDQPEEAARIANAVAEAYKAERLEQRSQLASGGIKALKERYAEQEQQVREAQKKVDDLQAKPQVPGGAPQVQAADVNPPKTEAPAPIPQPEVQTTDNAFSTFSLNVSDVSFKLAAASLEKGVMPEPATVRSEEFINAFDYRDPEPPPGVPVAFAWERAQYPFAQNRDLLRFSIKTAALGRQPGRALNIVLLLDNSGSMERADRVRIIREALRVLAGQLQPQDLFSIVTFARTAHLWVDGVPGNQAAQVAEEVSGLTPEGGTNLEDAMNLAYQTALRHYLASGVNRVVLLTDGAANLGTVDPEALKQKVEAHRKQGVALDCFGIGWEGYNDDLLEVLSRNGDGRYAFLNSPEEVASEFAAKLAGALQVAASDVKVQVEFNAGCVTAYRQIGYAKHQLTKEQFRDNTVNAAQIGAAEAGNALYTVEVNPAGAGPLCTVRVRFRIPGTQDYREHAWDVPFTGNAVALEQASPAMRLAATASELSEWLASSPYAGEVSPDRLLGYLSGVPEVYGADARPKKLEWMIRQAKSISGK
jgi:Mg-chelatase subunit ChlD/capsular polysaccharide biosynthesis protein